jgi:ribonuclease HII
MMRPKGGALNGVSDNSTGAVPGETTAAGPGARQPLVADRATAPRVVGALRPPRLQEERGLWHRGHRLVAGVDEVGRGAWAGPLSVGVAVMETEVMAKPGRRIPAGLRDSKALPEERREAIFDRVGAWCAAWAVGHVGADECDRLGMTAALRLATRRAFAALPPDVRPEAVLLDGKFDYVSPPTEPTLFGEDPLFEEHPVLQSVGVPVVRTLVRADARCASVAAASVLAKVTRDRMMRAMADSFPPFEFERNKGYPSPAHKRALCGYGLSAIHRRSWVFADHLPWR